MKNQTEERWITNVLDTDAGTGIFLAYKETPLNMVNMGEVNIIDVKSTFMGRSLQKVILFDCLYLDAVKQGNKEEILAFKWIPYHIALPPVVLNQASNCKRVLCVIKCARYGCLCFDGECK